MMSLAKVCDYSGTICLRHDAVNAYKMAEEQLNWFEKERRLTAMVEMNIKL